MDRTEAASEESELTAGQAGFVRFVIVGGGRTGSNLLVQALNSNPSIKCFGELFNPEMDGVGFSLPGYDNFSAKDRALRDGDFERFLRERVYCRPPTGVKAVGFKLLYPHARGFSGLQEWLAADETIRVLHIKRHNLLRMLISSMIAVRSGVWFEDRRLTLTNLWMAFRHPLRAAARLRRPLRRPKAEKVRVTVTAERCQRFFERVQRAAARYDDAFRDHPKMTLFYEDMNRDRRQALQDVQEFLGVPPQLLKVTMRRQDPEPLRELIANYDELQSAFKDTGFAAFFD